MEIEETDSRVLGDEHLWMYVVRRGVAFLGPGFQVFVQGLAGGEVPSVSIGPWKNSQNN